MSMIVFSVSSTVLALLALSNAVDISKGLSSWNCFGQVPIRSLLTIRRISDNAYQIYSHV